jgi:hypothetical protein
MKRQIPVTPHNNFRCSLGWHISIAEIIGVRWGRGRKNSRDSE